MHYSVLSSSLLLDKRITPNLCFQFAFQQLPVCVCERCGGSRFVLRVVSIVEVDRLLCDLDQASLWKQATGAGRPWSVPHVVRFSFCFSVGRRGRVGSPLGPWGLPSGSGVPLGPRGPPLRPFQPALPSGGVGTSVRPCVARSPGLPAQPRWRCSGLGPRRRPQGPTAAARGAAASAGPPWGPRHGCLTWGPHLGKLPPAVSIA